MEPPRHLYGIVFNQSTEQGLVDGQCVPGSVLDADRLQKKHCNSCVTGQRDSHLEIFEGRRQGVEYKIMWLSGCESKMGESRETWRASCGRWA